MMLQSSETMPAKELKKLVDDGCRQAKLVHDMDDTLSRIDKRLTELHWFLNEYPDLKRGRLNPYYKGFSLPKNYLRNKIREYNRNSLQPGNNKSPQPGNSRHGIIPSLQSFTHSFLNAV